MLKKYIVNLEMFCIIIQFHYILLFIISTYFDVDMYIQRLYEIYTWNIEDSLFCFMRHRLHILWYLNASSDSICNTWPLKVIKKWVQ